MPTYRRVSNEKGFVLVLALLITAILLLMAVTLSNSIDSYLRIVAATKEKNQSYYTAVAGSELLRDYLGRTNANPGNNWGGLLATVPADSSYKDRTATLTGSPIFGGVNFTAYFRDNEDGDDTYAADNDQIVMASITAQDPANGTNTTVEAMFIYSVENIYAMEGGNAGRTNKRRDSDGMRISEGEASDVAQRQAISH